MKNAIFCLVAILICCFASNTMSLAEDIKKFYPSGKLMKIIPYRNGEIDGVMKIYRENGDLSQEVVFERGVRKLENWYHKNGIQSAEKPIQNNKTHGVYKKYYDNGSLKQEVDYVNGVIEGMLKNYNQQGNLIEETPHKNGKADGIGKICDNDGTWYEVIFVDGIKKEVRHSDISGVKGSTPRALISIGN